MHDWLFKFINSYITNVAGIFYIMSNLHLKDNISNLIVYLIVYR